jgi:two-component system nitrogen regulation response regulator NtrX
MTRSRKNTQTPILIIDDDADLLTTLGRSLELAGYPVVTALSAAQARSELSQQEPAMIFMDVQLPDSQGLALLESTRKTHPSVPVVMITAYGKIEAAVQAVKMGAYDYLQKPIDRDRLLLTVLNVLEKVDLEKTRSDLVSVVQRQYEMVGDSPAMIELRKQITRIAATDEKVLILGETGCGKEVVAHAIYSQSRRVGRPFVKVNCAAIPRELIESELFGHRKGSFTGALDDYEGKFKQADGGTLLLDEIGDMSLEVQAKVLRALNDGEIEPVGGRGSFFVDVRVLAATNQDLEKMADESRFRRDLYYRLKAVPITVPPLRERREDIPLLMDHFLKQAAERNNQPLLELEADARHRLVKYAWPGNVRELAGLASWLSVFVTTPRVRSADLDVWFGGQENSEGITEYARAKEEFERDYFKRLVITLQGNMSAVARAANLDRSGLYRKLKSLGIVDDSPQ